MNNNLHFDKTNNNNNNTFFKICLNDENIKVFFFSNWAMSVYSFNLLFWYFHPEEVEGKLNGFFKRKFIKDIKQIP